MNPGKWKVNLNDHIFKLYKSAEIYHPVSLPCKGTSFLMFVTCGARFYLWVWSVQPPIQSLYPWVWCIYMKECSVHSTPLVSAMYLHARTFFTLADATSILMGATYLPSRMFCALAHTSSIPMGAIYLNI